MQVMYKSIYMQITSLPVVGNQSQDLYHNKLVPDMLSIFYTSFDIYCNKSVTSWT